MTAYQGKQLIEEISSRIDIVDLISEIVVLKKSGSGFLGLCPFHQEKSPSFNVNQQKQIFRCFGCGEGGNIFQFHMKYHNLDFKHALKELADRCGIEISHSDYKREETDKKEELKKNV
ncbi:DNA primase, partial [bacterium]